MVEEGWRFEWSIYTRFIGASHPNGGKMSIVEIEPRSAIGVAAVDEIGTAIARLLNGDAQ